MTPPPTSKSIHDYADYKAYLRDRLETTGEARGSRSRLAQALHCQTAFVSQVLNGDAQFSAEHALSISEFLQHSPEERHFFILLVQKERAGSKALEQYYESQLAEIRGRRKLIQERIQVKQGLSSEDQMTYYSSWIHSAVHILSAIPRFQRASAMAEVLQLPPAAVKQSLEFLEGVGLVHREGEAYRIGAARIHLGRGSPMIGRHHANWRMRALHSLDRADPSDLHYSTVVAISRADRERIREEILRFLERIEPIVQASPEEGCFSLTLDWFGV